MATKEQARANAEHAAKRTGEAYVIYQSLNGQWGYASKDWWQRRHATVETVEPPNARTYAFSVAINASGNTIDEARQTVEDWLSRAQDTAGCDGIEVQPFPIHVGEVVGNIIRRN